MDLFSKYKIRTKNKEIYIRALTHTSYANEANTISYERLEYLGDAVLELIMSEYLYNNTNYSEGEMTKIRANYVCEEALYNYSLKLELNSFLLLGVGEEENGGRLRKAIVADIFEAFIGAMFLDKGIEVVKKFIYKHVIPIIEESKMSFLNDYKSTLQEYVQTDKKSLEYAIISETGPAHNKEFTSVVKIDGRVYGMGTARSKKEAEQAAAADALAKCVK
ncbi:MAG: ribonuclease III [Bacilli bacterium]|nr:ribonuclease III [Bacilli bacterium]